MKKNLMSTKDKDSMIWFRNKNWYYIDEERDRFILTSEAPEEARISFEKYKRINKLEWKD